MNLDRQPPRLTNRPGRILPKDFAPNVHIFNQETPQELWNRQTAGRYECAVCQDPAKMFVRVYLPISYLVQKYPGQHFQENVLLDPEKCKEPYASFNFYTFCADHAKIGEAEIAHAFPSFAAIVVDHGPGAEKAFSAVPEQVTS